ERDLFSRASSPPRHCASASAGANSHCIIQDREVSIRLVWRRLSFAKSASKSPGDHSCPCDRPDPQGDWWAVVGKPGPSAPSGHRPVKGRGGISVWDGWSLNGGIVTGIALGPAGGCWTMRPAGHID